MFIPNNYDYPGNWAPTQPPLIGKNLDNGGEIDPLVEGMSGNRFYFNQQIRKEFATPEQKKNMEDRLKSDLGPLFQGWVENPSYAVSPADPLKRSAPVAVINGEKYTYGLLRMMTSTGKDRNSITIFDQRKYLLGFEGPGNFGYEVFLVDSENPRPEGAPLGVLTFTPPLIPPPPPFVDKPPFAAPEGHFWWKSPFGWTMVPVQK